MKRFFTKNGIWMLSAIAIVAVVLVIMAAWGDETSFVRNAAGVIASPFRSAARTVSGWVESAADHFQSIEDLQQENEDLRQQVADLQEQVRQGQADSRENANLRHLLQLRQQHSDFALESAWIVSRSASNWQSSFTLGKGTNFDIAIGDCVVDPYGYLVGVITDAGTNWSTVTTILDPESAIGATVFRVQSAAVAQGQLSLMHKGQLTLTYLADDESLIHGDLAVTSGLGGYYPAGLPIGTLEDVRTDDSGLIRYGVLTPKTDMAALTEVFVITDFTIVE